jgi:formylglycine-generating enzyme required for sulfatase activity/Cdc6-like AAA superfamily ATPase
MEETSMKKPARLLPILDDRPTHADALDFMPYCDTLVDIIDDPSTRTPLTIGIFGGWGSGKTSLMQMVSNTLREKLGRRNEEALTVWFNAWQYGKEETLWRALLLHVLDALRPPKPEGAGDNRPVGPPAGQESPDPSEEIKAWRDVNLRLDDMQASLYRDVEREEVGELDIDWEQLGKGALKGVVKIGLSYIPGFAFVKDLAEAGSQKTEKWATEVLDAFRREKTRVHLDHVRFLDQFRRRFEALVKEQVTGKGRKLVVFVDDLDRCLPEKAIDVLEAIKLFLDVEGCVFILGLDQDVVERGIKVKYRDFAVDESGEGKSKIPIDGAAYLQKIIQLPFLLPPVEPDDMESFVKSLVPEFQDARCVPVFAKGLREPNPRQVKRVINVFVFLQRLAEKRKLPVTPVCLAKVIVIQHGHPRLYAVLKEQPGLLAELEKYFREEESRMRAAGTREDSMAPRRPMEKEGEEGTPVHPRLADFVQRASLRTLLTMHSPDEQDVNFAGLTPQDLRPYFTLTSRAAPKVPDEEKPPEILEPQMVRVPAGKFEMGTSDEELHWLLENTDWARDWKKERWFDREQPRHTVYLPDFEIGRYPVMNSEYRAFVRDTKHRPPAHWEGDTYPEGTGDHPVVNVSWQDAEAYCDWLSTETDKEYRLPTEAEWEKAACWDEESGKRRRYPWGDEFDSKRANTAEGGPGKTTPVGQHSPAGDSPYGASDMAGNVWEWCQDWYEKHYYKDSPEENPPGPEKGWWRVLRGGSCYTYERFARCASRARSAPVRRDSTVGFRVSASPASP